VPFALIDADQHPLGMNVTRFQPDQLGDSQAAPVGRHQQHPMLDVGRGLEEPRDLAAAQRFGQSTAALGGNPQLEILLPEHFAVEEPDAGKLLVAGTIGHLPHRDQVMQKVADLLQGNLLGRAAVVAGQLGHGGHIALDGAGGLAMQLEFADHFSAQGSHGESSLETGNGKGNVAPFSVPLSAQSGSLCASKKPSHFS